MKSFLKFLVFVLFLALAISLIYVWQTKEPGVGQAKVEKFTPAEGPKIDLGSVDILQRLNEEYTKLFDAVVPSVVSITTTKTVQRAPDPFEFFFGFPNSRSSGRERVASLGSGFIVSKEGHILTNYHVVQGTDDILVDLNDGRQAKATVVGSDQQVDVAVLKINLPNLTPLSLADSDQVKVGQIVFAVGNPFGLRESVSQGIISARDRRGISDSSVEFFQTDTAINPGNSGGPLVDVKGEVVGINSVIYSESGGNQGVGFAIPSNLVRRTLKSIIEKGRAVRSYLGVSVQQITNDQAQQFKLDPPIGTMVTDVDPGSPAEKAGIIRGDIIQKINGHEVRDSAAVGNRIAETDIGSNVSIDLVREGQPKTLSAQIVEQPAQIGSRLSRNPSNGRRNNNNRNVIAFAGVEVRTLDSQLRSEANIPEDTQGVFVMSVDPSSKLSQELQAGDIIQAINNQPVASAEDFQKIAQQLDPSRPVVVVLDRDGQQSFVVVQPG
jgi:serine protease Do